MNIKTTIMQTTSKSRHTIAIYFYSAFLFFVAPNICYAQTSPSLEFNIISLSIIAPYLIALVLSVLVINETKSKLRQLIIDKIGFIPLVMTYHVITISMVKFIYR